MPLERGRYIFAGAVWVFMCLGSTCIAYSETVLRVTSHLPEKHAIVQNWRSFQKIVEERSGGTLRIQIFPGAQLFDDKIALDAVGAGAIDAGSVFLGRFSGAVPGVEVVSLPFLFGDETELVKAVSSGSSIRTILDAEILRETNVKVLWWQAFGRNVYLSNDGPLRQPRDLNGKKVRAYGKVPGWVVEALGGAPTLMSGSKQFLAYQQGAVDVGMTSVSSVRTRRLYEVMSHMTLSFDSPVEFVAVMNADIFDALIPEHQKIILDAAALVERQLRSEIYATEASDIAWLRGYIAVVELSDAERAEWQRATKGVAKKFAAERGPLAAFILKEVQK